VTSHPAGTEASQSTHFPRRSHTNPPTCCGAGTDTWQGGCGLREACFLRKSIVKKTPAHRKQLVEPGRDDINGKKKQGRKQNTKRSYSETGDRGMAIEKVNS